MFDDPEAMTPEQLTRLRAHVDERLAKLDTPEAREAANKQWKDRLNRMPDAEFNRRFYLQGFDDPARDKNGK